MSTLSFFVETNMPAPDIKITIDLDQEILWNNSISNKTKILCNIDDDVERDHVLNIVMSGKTIQDTVLDSNGNILEDKLVLFSNFEIDDINIDQIIDQQAKYQHNFNGTKQDIQDTFYKTMGCNGVVTLKFSTPVYLWLLENM